VGGLIPASALGRIEAFSARLLRPLSTVAATGRVSAISNSGVAIEGLSNLVRIGELVALGEGQDRMLAEVIKIERSDVLVRPYSNTLVARLNTRAQVIGNLEIAPHQSWKGRIISALADPIDGLGPLVQGQNTVAVLGQPPAALERSTVFEPLRTGVKAIDVFTPLCYGQRMGVFSGSGVGKSTLLAMLAQSGSFDCVVIALVGERGREVGEFVHDVLGPARGKSVVVVATGDEPATKRRLSALLATTLAEYFSGCGQRVLLMMDSVTRYAQACREIAIASGEPAVSRGYPPSVFSALPQLLERSGPGPQGNGSITGIYAVLVDGDNHNEPVADAIRGTLDGHLVLDRTIAASGRFPAIDVMHSVSRLSQKALNPDERASAESLRRLIARFEDSKDLRALGGYIQGQDAELDKSVLLVPRIYAALQQSPQDGPCTNPYKVLAKATATGAAAQ
jgi:flagellum-specific ATP synthase